MDAQSSGLLCFHIEGYTFDGKTCEQVNCGCVGTDCDALYETIGECRQAHADCLRAAGDPCAPMDATSSSFCPGDTYAWNGSRCLPICECAGNDCAETYQTEIQCRDAYSTCGANDCEARVRESRKFIDASKSCNTVFDCQKIAAGCGVTETGCTNEVYVNKSLDLDEYNALGAELSQCTGESCTPASTCRLWVPDPACVEGRCGPPEQCATEHSQMWTFLESNKACETAADCRTDFVGCGFSEDGCTQAVFVNEATDTGELERLRTELGRCLGDPDGCPGAACERAIGVPACVEGRCVNSSGIE